MNLHLNANELSHDSINTLTFHRELRIRYFMAFKTKFYTLHGHSFSIISDSRLFLSADFPRLMI
jgi:hypothetical protein